jgi:hypothetical protein
MSLVSYALTTRQRVKDFLDISADDATTNNVIDRIINSVTDWVENYCDRRFLKTTYTNEKYDGRDYQSLLLRNYPIDMDSTLTLSYRNSWEDEEEWTTVPSDEYFKYPDEGRLEYPKAAIGDRGRIFRRGGQNYRVTYSAGYDFDNAATFLSDVGAADLEYVVWKLCGVAWNSRRGGDDVISESIGQYSVKYSKEAFEDEKLTDILNKYARIERVQFR